MEQNNNNNNNNNAEFTTTIDASQFFEFFPLKFTDDDIVMLKQEAENNNLNNSFQINENASVSANVSASASGSSDIEEFNGEMGENNDLINNNSMDSSSSANSNSSASASASTSANIEYTSSTSNHYNVSMDNGLILVNGVYGLDNNQYIPDLAIFRYIDGIHDFDGNIDGIKEILSRQHNINSNLRLVNASNKIIKSANNLSSQKTLHNLIELYSLPSEQIVRLTNEENIEYFSIKVPKIHTIISFDKLRTIEHYFKLVNETLDNKTDIIIKIEGKDSDFYDDVIKNKTNSVLKSIIKTTYNIYSKDSINLNDNFFINLYDGNQGKYYLSGLVDPAPGKNQLKLKEPVSYKLLYTHINEKPVTCIFSNLSSQEIKPNSYKVQFFYNNNSSYILEVDTTKDHLSPSIADISEYINSKLLAKYEQSTKNKLLKLININSSNYKINKDLLTLSLVKSNKIVDWTQFFDTLLFIFNSLIEGITLENAINLLVSFKTIGDQMYFYDSLALSIKSNNVSVVSGDGFLIDYIINTKKVSTINSAVSGKNGIKTIEYYKSPLINLNSNENIEQNIEQNKREITSTILAIKQKNNEIKTKIDYIINNTYKILTSIRYEELQNESRTRQYKDKYSYTINLASPSDSESDSASASASEEPEAPIKVTSLFCSYFYYATSKFYAMYLIALKEIEKVKEIRTNTTPTKIDVLNTYNILYYIDNFYNQIRSIKFNGIQNIIDTFLTLIDNQECFRMIPFNNYDDYNEFLISTVNLLITEEMKNLYSNIKISGFIYNVYLQTVQDVNYSKSILLNNKKLTSLLTYVVEKLENEIIKILDPVPVSVPVPVPGSQSFISKGGGNTELKVLINNFLSSLNKNEFIDKTIDLFLQDYMYILDNIQNVYNSDILSEKLEQLLNLYLCIETFNNFNITDKDIVINHNSNNEDNENINNEDNENINNQQNSDNEDNEDMNDDISIQENSDNEDNESINEYMNDDISINDNLILDMGKDNIILINELIDQIIPFTDKAIINIKNGVLSTSIINFEEQNEKLNSVYQKPIIAESSEQLKRYKTTKEPNPISIISSQQTDNDSMMGSDNDSDSDIGSDSNNNSQNSYGYTTADSNGTHNRLTTPKAIGNKRNVHNENIFQVTSPTVVTAKTGEINKGNSTFTFKKESSDNFGNLLSDINSTAGGSRKVKRVKKKYLTKRKQDMNKKNNKKTKVNKKYKNKNKKTRKH